MINQNELRIGNLVNRTKSSRNDIIGHVQFDESDWYGIGECIDYLENYEPIPLTEDWLVKLGFEKYNECFYKIELKRGYSDGWYLSHENELTKSMSEFMIRVKYVHELQNLYFALTGEELTIKQND